MATNNNKKAKVSVPAGASLFTQLYLNGADTIKAQQQSIVERQLKRKLSAAYDDAETKLLGLEQDMNEQLGKLSGLDVNDIIDIQEEIDALERAKNTIATMFVKLFGEDLETV